ncbi:unnamed protein product [Bursaphelenchus okinawaensis]|uniref:Uncharacterized protein n=1 Tax=Bursaphelenchus okinawaensis TaxID=465554 RepID=A0A811JRN0_9BILA|nr:unnamed protein product [Bursaphelenchus okinawaensis]CAG9080438.1 unnamed protein product [Bursaphelenchus okinawaensis]
MFNKALFFIGEHIIFNDCEAPCQQFDATRQITYINEIKYLYLVGLNKIRLYYKTESTFEVYINNRMFTVPNRLRPGREVTKYKLSGSLTQYEEMCMDFRNLMTLNYCVAPCHKVDPSTKVILYRDVGEKIKTFEENRFGFYYVSPRRLLLTINDVWKFYLNVNIKEGIKMTKFKITGYANLQYVCMNLIN